MSGSERWHVVELDSADSRAQRYQLANDGVPMAWSDVLHAWADSPVFVDFYVAILAGGHAQTFRWETPPLVQSGLNAPHEFVVVESPRLDRVPDSSVFDQHFGDGQVATFANLGGDAMLIAPCPAGVHDDYAHLGAFLRSAPRSQVLALFAAVATLVNERSGNEPMWLSTAGAGVPWLHIRLDNSPKYYAYQPYRTWLTR